jgi:hypothetical protein
VLPPTRDINDFASRDWYRRLHWRSSTIAAAGCHKKVPAVLRCAAAATAGSSTRRHRRRLLRLRLLVPAPRPLSERRSLRKSVDQLNAENRSTTCSSTSTVMVRRMLPALQKDAEWMKK